MVRALTFAAVLALCGCEDISLDGAGCLPDGGCGATGLKCVTEPAGDICRVNPVVTVDDAGTSQSSLEVEPGSGLACEYGPGAAVWSAAQHALDAPPSSHRDVLDRGRRGPALHVAERRQLAGDPRGVASPL